ncbi:MAG TPA: hypothetical protein VGP38_00425, partial [Rubrobacter sp.]|nr:hypothetical protein [Rubrobacter sp.]
SSPAFFNWLDHCGDGGVTVEALSDQPRRRREGRSISVTFFLEADHSFDHNRDHNPVRVEAGSGESKVGAQEKKPRETGLLGGCRTRIRTWTK